MSESARRIVLSAASRPFMRFGYKATMMDAVAKAAKVGMGPDLRTAQPRACSGEHGTSGRKARLVLGGTLYGPYPIGYLK